MAITKLNSLAIPPDTIVESDLSYPLTNFSSTGIDDNATSTAITIDASQNVGIGTISPDYPLDVAGTTRIRHAGTDLFATIRGPNNRDLRIDIDANGDGDSFIVRDLRDGSERFTVQAGGNVGIGTTSPAATFGKAGSLDANGIVVSRGQLNANQTNAVVLEYGSNIAAIRAYGATAGTGQLVFKTGGGGGSADNEAMRIASSGYVGIGTTSPTATLHVNGSVSKSSGSFRIDHPIKPETHDLVHSFVEAPQADNIYRGKVELVNGTATVNIDTVAGMTEGTFATLNREVQCFTTNESGWTAIKGSVNGNIITIEAQDNTCTDTISWLVIGERQDQHMYDTEWTDENGKVILEPLKGA